MESAARERTLACNVIRTGAVHTLLIPTYNRPAFVRQLVGYYAERAGSMNLLVLDSSEPSIAAQNASALASHGDALRHICLPTSIPMAAKLAHGLALVTTPYASFCADDDLVFPAGLREAIAFLERHPDYVSAHGLYLNFRQASPAVHLMREYASPGNEASHPCARIFRLFQKYESLFYGVFRTADLRKIFDAVSSLPTLHYQELFQSVGALIMGKVQRFPRLYAARQSCEPAEPSRDKWQTYYWFASDPADLLFHYHGYRDALWAFYDRHAAAPRLDRAAFYRVLDLAHAVYFSAQCPPEYFHSVLADYWPEDHYLELAKVDLFERLGGRRPSARLTPERVVAGARRRLGASWSRLALARLDREVRRAYRTPWRCRLPSNLRWLARTPEFRRAYLELCHYLDRA
jgi:glycosyltransferase domain-containing protein